MSVEEKLLHWRTLYGEWVSAELRLRQARAQQPDDPGVTELEAQVRRLQQDCNSALDAIDTLFAAGRGHPAEEADTELRHHCTCN